MSAWQSPDMGEIPNSADSLRSFYLPLNISLSDSSTVPKSIDYSLLSLADVAGREAKITSKIRSLEWLRQPVWSFAPGIFSYSIINSLRKLQKAFEFTRPICTRFPSNRMMFFER